MITGRRIWGSMKKLSDCELEIMLIIWKANEPVQSSFIGECMKDRKWAKTTILNFLARLVDKGFLSCESQGKINTYTPIIKRDDYLRIINVKYIGQFYGSSVRNMVAGFYQHRLISGKDLEELRIFIEEKAREEEARRG